MRLIPVYRKEIELGLAEQVRASGSVAYASALELADAPAQAGKALARFLAREKAKATNAGQPDLKYLKTVLVSTGWNKNTDVFDRGEVWAARRTPEDKPFNYEHACADIIGHITDNQAVGDDGVALADDLALDDLPEKFHVVTGAVLYKVWDDDKLQARMDDILAEIPAGKWFVSMEALFADFDYALVGKADAKVVRRQQSTAWLTKHLRAYGGDGRYGDYQVGRLLRGITFSGKGLVRKPANPESIIFPDTEAFSATASDFFTPQEDLGYGTTSNGDTSPQTLEELAINMANEQATAALEAKVAELTAANEKLHKQLQETSTKELTVANEKLAESLKVNDQKITDLDEQVKTLAGANEVLTASVARLTKERDEAATKLADIEVAKKKAARVATVAQTLELTEDKAAEFAATIEDLSDEKFAKAVKAQADYLADKKAAYTAAPKAGDGAEPKTAASPVKVGAPQAIPQSTDKPAPMAGMPPKVATVKADADPKVLDTAEPKIEPALATTSTDDGVETVRANVAEFMGQFLSTGKKKKK